METSKKTYQEPEVTKVEFDFNETIVSSGGCEVEYGMLEYDGTMLCYD